MQRTPLQNPLVDIKDFYRIHMGDNRLKKYHVSRGTCPQNIHPAFSTKALLRQSLDYLETPSLSPKYFEDSSSTKIEDPSLWPSV